MLSLGLAFVRIVFNRPFRGQITPLLEASFFYAAPFDRFSQKHPPSPPVSRRSRRMRGASKLFKNWLQAQTPVDPAGVE